ncbi:AraC family transcriptional regulator [Microbulbifer sp. ALW1]|uniref:AraC family transcriptional regulator n=1 Tax=Microbulbifer sp. (strain ALW1) TaxID=1516059 RepID=UPI00135680CB|nr:AraC family transcriptional regulator [Microbulbifer sp. ALW1]
MKPMLEKILPEPDCSWRFWLYELDEIEFNWHYHPEYEIALTLNSKGHRYVGDSVEAYTGVDMALTGPDLPHTWCSQPEREGEQVQTYVAQLPAPWLHTLMSQVPELEGLRSLMQRSERGILFSREVTELAVPIFTSLAAASPIERIIGLLQILRLQAGDKESRILASAGYKFTAQRDSYCERIDRVIGYIYENYCQPLRADALADLANMSTNHFHRFIKQRTEQTFTELVNQLRIGKACSLLINSDQPIAAISDLCGFNNLSNFNRRFRHLKNMTPSQFRTRLRQTKL